MATKNKLNIQKTKGRISNLKVMPYRGCPVYIRKIDFDIFEYIIIFNNEVYTDYIILETPNKTLTKKEILGGVGMIMTAATVTVDTLYQLAGEKAVSNSIPNKKEVN